RTRHKAISDTGADATEQAAHRAPFVASKQRIRAELVALRAERLVLLGGGVGVVGCNKHACAPECPLYGRSHSTFSSQRKAIVYAFQINGFVVEIPIRNQNLFTPARFGGKATQFRCGCNMMNKNFGRCLGSHFIYIVAWRLAFQRQAEKTRNVIPLRKRLNENALACKERGEGRYTVAPRNNFVQRLIRQLDARNFIARCQLLNSSSINGNSRRIWIRLNQPLSE